jgi:hypothetical protein
MRCHHDGSANVGMSCAEAELTCSCTGRGAADEETGGVSRNTSCNGEEATPKDSSEVDGRKLCTDDAEEEAIVPSSFTKADETLSSDSRESQEEEAPA